MEFRKNRIAIKVDGPEANKLLSDVLTAAVPDKVGQANWWALLSPQGKIQTEGLISKYKDAYYLDVHASIADSFLKRMGMYKLRAKANIADLRQSHLVGWSQQLPTENLAIIDKDQRHENLGFRVICEVSQTENWQNHATGFDARRVALGLAELGLDFSSDQLFPHDIAMELLNGIDFEKGCYVGQEVVSRMRHRGMARKRPVVVLTRSANQGDELEIAGKTVGFVGMAINGKAVGIVRLDRLGDAKTVTLSGQPVELAVPAWASYDFADSVQN